ncbi:TetR/AcrR family transcriptional regulator [Vibrio alginolyticus]|uniref:TetR/AcrR family transcriptional regulator n=1 Tax=Vibrio alginolyticus TaxID=663 RepID=A0A7Y0MXF5_VIBAL|nr:MULTISPECIES: TetR/AcrR family transcriptional regulator [Vibrio]QCO88945.1 TetR/AcrR family transcriptional regulator [Vibrio neocaledonicus]QIR90313.1 TetR family transcriptional regulator [Vibrio diabolicus]EGQ7647622.1 TetR/AcrR family transcriptional regulator [Vibrio alginolyticus]EGQ9235223.1 TetR/AcrR family transcriptional regulator [Vibrio alginolyticus]EGR0712238.1 TetR/AcrR family transcriptional regulator [Vibrio alginolyticus]
MNKKKQLLIDTALSLFYKQGINSIGINEVLNVSGVAKRTLYNHFESKEALIIAALEQRHQIFMEWLEEKLSSAQTCAEVIDQLFTALNGWFHGSEEKLGEFRGCFFINTSAEFSDDSGEIATYCRYHKQQVRELIQRYLKSDNASLLDAICIMKEGAITTAYMTKEYDNVTKKCVTILHKL